MARFSERYGYTSVTDVMQLEFIDDELINGLWSAFYDTIIQFGRQSASGHFPVEESEYRYLLPKLWKKFYKLPIDEIPLNNWFHSVKTLRQNFYEELEWFEVYYLEFVAQNLSTVPKGRFIKACNEVLRQEMAGYRFVGDEIVQITSNEEIAEIEQAINDADMDPVSSHLKRSLEFP